MIISIIGWTTLRVRTTYASNVAHKRGIDVKTAALSKIEIRKAGVNHWLSLPQAQAPELHLHEITPEVISTEEEIGAAQLDELRQVARSKSGNIVILLLGGRGAQAFHRKLGRLATEPQAEEWFGRLHVFMQDALAPMPQNSTLNFTYDFRRLLGQGFFDRVAGFYELHTDAADLHSELTRYVERLFELGGPDIFYLGHGPEANDASHLAYIRPGSGAILAAR
jgi:6-phosphogluconolactonase/glucosamine-6-phosphate isomerase/deaminase